MINEQTGSNNNEIKGALDRLEAARSRVGRVKGFYEELNEKVTTIFGEGNLIHYYPDFPYLEINTGRLVGDVDDALAFQTGELGKKTSGSAEELATYLEKIESGLQKIEADAIVLKPLLESMESANTSAHEKFDPDDEELKKAVEGLSPFLKKGGELEGTFNSLSQNIDALPA